MNHPIEKLEQLLFEVLGHVSDAKASESLHAAIKLLDAVKDERNEHDNLIRTCSPLVKEEDRSNLIPNWCRVQNALMRLVSERNEAIRRLKEFVEAWSDEAGYSNVFHEDADKARNFLVRIGEKVEQR